jgi:hypothetical protein
MELNIPGLRAFFEPYDVPHLLRLWVVLALIIIMFALIIAIIGVYPQARQFWKVHIVVLGATLLLSGVVFLLFHLDPLLLLLSLPCAAFIVQGDLGVDWK